MQARHRTILLCCVAAAMLGIVIGCSGKHEAPSAPITRQGVSDSSSAMILPDSLLTYEQRQGKSLYQKYCTVCHGDDGKGAGFNAYNLDPKPQDFTDRRIMNSLTDDRLAQTIYGGGRSVNKSPLMPPWGGRLQKTDIDYLVAYIRALCPSH